MRNRFNTIGPRKAVYAPGTFCRNWDSDRPEWLSDNRTGDILGLLLPRTNRDDSVPALLGYQRHS